MGCSPVYSNEPQLSAFDRHSLNCNDHSPVAISRNQTSAGRIIGKLPASEALRLSPREAAVPIRIDHGLGRGDKKRRPPNSFFERVLWQQDVFRISEKRRYFAASSGILICTLPVSLIHSIASRFAVPQRQAAKFPWKNALAFATSIGSKFLASNSRLGSHRTPAFDSARPN